uniref:Secreted protein n=1 Tax=Haemonchus placei TaxID=6290 RepID=A0A0N4W7M0_HAEPC
LTRLVQFDRKDFVQRFFIYRHFCLHASVDVADHRQLLGRSLGLNFLSRRHLLNVFETHELVEILFILFFFVQMNSKTDESDQNAVQDDAQTYAKHGHLPTK